MKSITFAMAAAALVAAPLVVLAMPGHQEGKGAESAQGAQPHGMPGGQGMSAQMGQMHGQMHAQMHAQMEKMHKGMHGAMSQADCHGAQPDKKPGN